MRNDWSVKNLPATVLAGGRYTLLKELGRGAQGRTFLGQEVALGRRVAIKELDFGRIDRFKAYELFEREARVLATLDIPSVPRYLDYFTQEDAAGQLSGYYLVQEYIEGENLQQLVDAGKLFTEDEVLEFLEQLLDILEHLHAQKPQLIHRDVKPSNIIWRAGDARYFLVDFGAVHEKVVREAGSSTVIGTSGYAPLEQLMGRALPASDLYALGATAVHLATGVEPWRLPTVRNRVQFEHKVSVSEHLKGVLCAMLEPEVGARVQDVVQARARLDGRPLPAPIASQTGALTDIEDIYDMSRARAGNTGNIRVSMHGEQLHVEFYGTERFSVVYALLAWLGYFWAAPGDPLSDISSGFWLFALLGVPGMYLVARAIAGNLLGDNRRRQSLVVSPTRVELRRQSHLGLGHWRPARRVVWSIPRQQVKEIDWQDGFESADHRAQALNARGRHRYRVNLHLTDEAGVQYPIQVDRGKLQKPDILAENNAVTQVLRVIQAYLRDY